MDYDKGLRTTGTVLWQILWWIAYGSLTSVIAILAGLLYLVTWIYQASGFRSSIVDAATGRQGTTHDSQTKCNPVPAEAGDTADTCSRG